LCVQHALVDMEYMQTQALAINVITGQTHNIGVIVNHAQLTLTQSNQLTVSLALSLIKFLFRTQQECGHSMSVGSPILLIVLK